MSPGSFACFGVIQSPQESLSSVLQCISYIFSESSPLPVFYLDFSVVRTRGGSRIRPRVRFSTPEREAPAQLRSLLQYHQLSPRQYLRSLRDFVDTRHGWDPGPHPRYLRGELGGPGPPSGPAHRAQASHLPLGCSHHQSHLLQR